jgi:hypothetical protein
MTTMSACETIMLTPAAMLLPEQHGYDPSKEDYQP